MAGGFGKTLTTEALDIYQQELTIAKHLDGLNLALRNLV
jgi:hypothetical protein